MCFTCRTSIVCLSSTPSAGGRQMRRGGKCSTESRSRGSLAACSAEYPAAVARRPGCYIQVAGATPSAFYSTRHGYLATWGRWKQGLWALGTAADSEGVIIQYLGWRPNGGRRPGGQHAAEGAEGHERSPRSGLDGWCLPRLRYGRKGCSC